MTRVHLSLWPILVISSASAQPAIDGAEFVGACRNELAQRQSSHIVNGQLTARWSAAWTISYSASQLTFVSIRDSLPEEQLDHSQLAHDWAILCTVDETGKVVSLVSPENNELIQFVENGDSIEERDYAQIAAKLSEGIAVYRYDTFYRVDGYEVTQLGETRRSEVDRSDFQVE